MTFISSKLLEKINANPIDKEDMLMYIHSLQATHEPPTYAHCVEVAMSVFNKNSTKCFSLNIRLEALNRILSSGELHGWINTGDEEGSFYIPENVFIAAGTTPLVTDGPRISFEKNSLLKAAFKLGKLT